MVVPRLSRWLWLGLLLGGMLVPRSQASSEDWRALLESGRERLAELDYTGAHGPLFRAHQLLSEEANPDPMDLIRVKVALVLAYSRLGEDLEAEYLHYEIVTLALEKFPEDKRLHSARLNEQAYFLDRIGKFAEAEPGAREAVALARSLQVRASTLGAALDTLALSLHGQGKLEEAEQYYVEAKNILQKEATDDQTSLSWLVQLAEGNDHLAKFYRETGRPEMAPEYEEAAQEIRRKIQARTGRKGSGEEAEGSASTSKN